MVPGATASIVNKETNLTRDTVTNAEGDNLANVPPGLYDLKVSCKDSAAWSTGPVAISQIPRIDMALALDGQRNGHSRVRGAAVAD